MAGKLTGMAGKLTKTTGELTGTAGKLTETRGGAGTKILEDMGTKVLFAKMSHTTTPPVF